MIRHICMFKLKEEAGGKPKAENLETAVIRLKELCDLPSVIHADVVTGAAGMPASNYDLCLIFDFESADALNAYQVHPKHMEFGAFIAEMRESRACIDYKL